MPALAENRLDRRAFLKTAFGFVGGVVLIGCGGAAAPSGTGPAPAAGGAPAAGAGAATQVPTVRIAASRGIVSAPIWNTGKHAAKYGFKTDMSVLFTYADQQRAAQSKQTEAATSGITNVPSMADQGVTNLKVIAGQVSGGQNLILRKGVQAKTWKDLEGKTIGVTPGTYARILFLIAARENGADLNKIKLQNLSSGETALQALGKGDLDGFVLFAPTTDQAVVQGIGFYPPGLDIGASKLGPANSIIIANTDFLGNKELAANFMRAYVDSLHEMQDEAAFTAVATQLAGVPAAVAKEAFKHLYFSELIDVPAIKGSAALGPEFGFAKTDTSAKVESYLDFGPLMAATGKTQAQLSGTPPEALKMVGK